jgi:hypothetical protein
MVRSAPALLFLGKHPQTHLVLNAALDYYTSCGRDLAEIDAVLPGRPACQAAILVPSEIDAVLPGRPAS